MKLVIKSPSGSIREHFRKYTDIADYLDSHTQFANMPIFLFNSKRGLPVNVKFDGVSTFIEGYGNV